MSAKQNCPGQIRCIATLTLGTVINVFMMFPSHLGKVLLGQLCSVEVRDTFRKILKSCLEIKGDVLRM